MLDNGELMEIFKSDFILIKEHNYTYNDLNEMLPFERNIQIALVMEYLEKKKQLKQ